MINAVTPMMVQAGHRIFQIHRFGDSEDDHVRRLERWADFPIGAAVIDLGCGVGTQVALFNELRPDLSFCLVNISQTQLDYASGKYPVHCCDFCNVPEPDASFDAAMFCFSIGHADHMAALAEAARLLRVGGVLFVYDMARIHGSNDCMAGVYYAVHDRKFMEAAAAAAGFRVDFYMEPTDSGEYGRAVLGEDFEMVFSGTIPAIWRFIKT